MLVFFDTFLSDQQCGYRKEYSTQHCLFNDFTSVVLISNITLILFFVIKMEELCYKSIVLELYLQISQRHLIVSIMNYLLQNSTHMDLAYLHYTAKSVFPIK